MRPIPLQTFASGLAAAGPLLAAGAPALGIHSALDGDANRPISRCAHGAPHSRTHPEGSMLGAGRGRARAAPACLIAGAAPRMGASARSGANVHDAPRRVGEDLCSLGAFFPGAEPCFHCIPCAVKLRETPSGPARGCEEGRSGAVHACPARERAVSVSCWREHRGVAIAPSVPTRGRVPWLSVVISSGAQSRLLAAQRERCWTRRASLPPVPSSQGAPR